MKKTIVIGVTGGIAAYKIADLCSRLRKQAYDVHVLMSKNATEFITPLTLQTLTNNKVCVDNFETIDQYDVHHISLAKKADLFLLAPCTANVLAKVVHGLADDLLTTTFLAATCPKLICLAMNTQMYENPITQDNIKRAKSYGMHFVEPETGVLACKDVGKGRLASLDHINEAIDYHLTQKCLAGKRVLVSAGCTQEAIDPVRFISNHSSGKMGLAIARQAANMGAQVTLVHGPVNVEHSFVNLIGVSSSEEMFEAMKKEAVEADFIIKAAAVADYTPCETMQQKLKKNEEIFDLKLKKTQDILAYLGEHKPAHQVICGFAMETEDLIENARKKLVKKHLDMIVANNLNTQGAGFKTDTNVVSIIDDENVESLDLMSKDELAKEILLRMLKRREDVINH
ncbi:MAG: bifunctional phosphopantothenoylcysteine decarboxylase/phosphopantothenate--cysteine ligase CoaBC [Erysipelotrichaceae bacterium]